MGTMKPLRERKFQAAVSIVQNLPKSGPISTPLSTMLQFYALYKQATEGPNQTPKPAFYDIVRKTKWDAWTKLGSMTKEEAMQRYIDDFVAIVDSTTHGSNVEEMIKSLGTLYEAVNDDDIDLLLGPTIDRLFAKSGCQKLARMKDKILKSAESLEKSNDKIENNKDGIVALNNNVDSSPFSPLRVTEDEDRRFETRQSQYYMDAPSQIEDEQVRDAYQLRSGGVRNGGTGVTTWSQCVQRAGNETSQEKQHTADQPLSQQTVPHNQQTVLPSAQSRLYQVQEQDESVDQLHELSIVAESMISIEHELTHVAEKLNSISKLYKSQCCSTVSIPTLSLILVWPVLTQLVFMWYSSRRNVQSSR